MFKKSFVLLLIVSVWAMGLRLVSAQSEDYLATSKVRAKVQDLGINTHVQVKFRDQTKMKGEIVSTDRESFSINSETGGNIKVPYSDVDDVKKAGSGGWGTKHWIILGSAVAGAAVTWAIVKPALCDGGAQTRGPC